MEGFPPSPGKQKPMNHTRSSRDGRPRTARRTPVQSLGHATARGVGAGVAVVRIVQIARLARQDDAAVAGERSARAA